MPTSGDLKSGDFFWTSTLPTLKSFFDLDPPLPPSPQAILWEKHQSICQGLQLVEYSSRDSHFYRSNKEETLFFLFATNNVHSHRKMKPETVIQA